MLKEDFGAKKNQKIAPFHSFPSSEPATFKRISSWLSEPKLGQEKKILEAVQKCIQLALPVNASMISGQGERTEWHNFSGDFVERSFIRQSKRGVEISWKFLLNESKSNEEIALCFTGGLGWKTEPETGGFMMYVNGKSSVAFDVTTSPRIWSSSDQRIKLLYLPTWSSDLDSGGFFFLHALKPNDQEKTNLKISVISKGEGSKRWFAIDLEQKIRERLKNLKNTL